MFKTIIITALTPLFLTLHLITVLCGIAIAALTLVARQFKAREGTKQLNNGHNKKENKLVATIRSAFNAVAKQLWRLRDKAIDFVAFIADNALTFVCKSKTNKRNNYRSQLQAINAGAAPPLPAVSQYSRRTSASFFSDAAPPPPTVLLPTCCNYDSKLLCDRCVDAFAAVSFPTAVIVEPPPLLVTSYVATPPIASPISTTTTNENSADYSSWSSSSSSCPDFPQVMKYALSDTAAMQIQLFCQLHGIPFCTVRRGELTDSAVTQVFLVRPRAPRDYHLPHSRRAQQQSQHVVLKHITGIDAGDLLENLVRELRPHVAALLADAELTGGTTNINANSSVVSSTSSSAAATSQQQQAQQPRCCRHRERIAQLDHDPLGAASGHLSHSDIQRSLTVRRLVDCSIAPLLSKAVRFGVAAASELERLEDDEVGAGGEQQHSQHRERDLINSLMSRSGVDRHAAMNATIPPEPPFHNDAPSIVHTGSSRASQPLSIFRRILVAVAIGANSHCSTAIADDDEALMLASLARASESAAARARSRSPSPQRSTMTTNAQQQQQQFFTAVLLDKAIRFAVAIIPPFVPRVVIGLPKQLRAFLAAASRATQQQQRTPIQATSAATAADVSGSDRLIHSRLRSDLSLLERFVGAAAKSRKFLFDSETPTAVDCAVLAVCLAAVHAENVPGLFTVSNSNSEREAKIRSLHDFARRRSVKSYMERCMNFFYPGSVLATTTASSTTVNSSNRQNPPPPPTPPSNTDDEDNNQNNNNGNGAINGPPANRQTRFVSPQAGRGGGGGSAASRQQAVEEQQQQEEDHPDTDVAEQHLLDDEPQARQEAPEQAEFERINKILLMSSVGFTSPDALLARNRKSMSRRSSTATSVTGTTSANDDDDGRPNAKVDDDGTSSSSSSWLKSGATLHRRLMRNQLGGGL